MRSFMSSFAEFAIRSSGFKKRVGNPVKREKYFNSLRKKSKKPFTVLPYPFRSKVNKERAFGVELLTFNKGREKKLIYLHGGAFCEPPRILHLTCCDNISAHTDYEIIFPIYKRAPESTFEETYAFLEKFYKKLLVNTKPENIVFMGDSSGGGLALSFAEYLKQLGLSQPKRIIMLSPWLDLSMEKPFLPELDKLDPNLQHGFLKAAGKYWAGETDLHDYRLSPIYGDFTQLAPMTLFTGTHEAFLTDSRRFKEECEKKGVILDYREWEGMNHVFVVYPIPEAKEAQKEIIEILNSGE